MLEYFAVWCTEFDVAANIPEREERMLARESLHGFRRDSEILADWMIGDRLFLCPSRDAKSLQIYFTFLAILDLDPFMVCPAIMNPFK